MGPPRGFHLEAVAVHVHVPQSDGFEQLATPCLEPAGEIAVRQQQHRARKGRSAAADHAPIPRPPDRPATGHVPSPECQVRADHERRQEPWKVARVVGEVGVHLHHRVGVGTVEDPPKPGAVGGTEALLRRAVQDRDPRLPRSNGVGQVPRSIGGAIIDDQHVGLRKSLEDRAEDALQVLDLVEAYTAEVRGFYEWLSIRQQQIHKKEFDELNTLQSGYRQLVSGFLVGDELSES